MGNVAQDNKKIHYMRIVSVIEKSLENFLTNFNFDYEMKKIDFTFTNTYVQDPHGIVEMTLMILSDFFLLILSEN